MNTPINDGGNAYPGTKGVEGHGNYAPVSMPDGSTGWASFSQGMSLRDWFAGQSMSILADPNIDLSPESLARACYRNADAMIAARGAKQ